MRILIIRRQEESSFKPLEDEVEKFRADAYVRHLNRLGVKKEEYEDIYELAVQIYNKTANQNTPFGVDFLIKAGIEFKKNKIESKVYVKPDFINVLPNCSSCKGSKISYILKNGKPIGINYEIKEGKKVAKVCEDCK